MLKNFEELRSFYHHRLALNHGDDSSKETPEYWDAVAESFSKKAHSPKGRKESESFLDTFFWEVGEKVLDVASGPGTFAIPLALRGCKVLATDFSAEMLKQLSLQAKKENCPSIECIQGRWLEVDLQCEFDSLICMNGLGVISTDANHKARLGETLEKLNKLAKKRIIILVPHADSYFDNEMRHILGEHEIPMERLRIALIYYAMVDHGMLPSLKIIKKPFTWTFKDVEEACSTLFRKGGVQNIHEDTKSRFKSYVESLLKKEPDGSFTLSYPTYQALFTVEK